jgi:hypothetical protein
MLGKPVDSLQEAAVRVGATLLLQGCRAGVEEGFGEGRFMVAT